MNRNPDSPWNPAVPCDISPTQFEELVLDWLRLAAEKERHTVELIKQGKVSGSGGEYAIDVLLKFHLAGANVVVLAECKHQKRPVEREKVLVLETKLRDTGGHKGMLFSTSGFQSGAIRYASDRGIATITAVSGDWIYETRSAGPDAPPDCWAYSSEFAGIRLTTSGDGIDVSTIHNGRLGPLVEWLSEIQPD